MNLFHLNPFSVLVVLCVLASLFAIPAVRHRLAQSGRALLLGFATATNVLANDGPLTVGVHAGGRVTGYHESAPVTTRFLLVKKGAADNTYALVTSIADMPVAVCTDDPTGTDDPVNFQWFGGADQTVRCVAAGAIADGSIVVTNGDGKVKQMPAVAGVYWQVGVAVTTAVADGDLVEVAPGLQQVGVSFVT